MGFGRYRFRRSFGNVASQFRGARPSTYPLFSGLLDQYPNAAAAYSLRALSAGWLAGDVVEVRRSSDSTTQDFTASQITGGQMLSFVNGGTTDLYNSARYFDGVNTLVALNSAVTMTGDFSVSFRFTFEGGSSVQEYTGGTIATQRFLYNGSNNTYFISNGVSNATFTGLTPIVGLNSLSLDRVGSSLTMTLNGATDVQTFTANFVVDQLGARFGDTNNIIGVIYDINLNNQAAYTGLGTSVTAWQDTIGSNDGTEANGTAYTGQPFNGFVSTWYDQSGNANDATQATTTKQPKIVSAGVLVVGGLDFDGVDDSLGGIANLVSGTSAASSFIVGNADTTATNDAMISQGNNGVTGEAYVITSEIAFRPGGNTIYDDDFIDAGSLLLSTIAPAGSTSADVLMFLDGSAMGQISTTSATLNYTVSTADIGTNKGVTFFDGRLAEVIVYASNQSTNRVAIEANINSAYTLF